ncbi:unnamed protein product [Meloidogyne enterolobii]|uniref:Uncharacterized protein n=1 Tax=Meloidogyne enterolobii TaxID=390850 RepID=A0ACB0ZPY0_MELEN
MFVGHILLVNYLLSICFIQIAASNNNNELGKEEDNGLGSNVFKERVKRGEETQGSINPIIIIGILAFLGICIGSIIGYFLVRRYNRKKAELAKRKRHHQRLLALHKDLAQKRIGSKEVVVKDEVKDEVKEDKDKDGEDNSRMTLI